MTLIKNIFFVLLTVISFLGNQLFAQTGKTNTNTIYFQLSRTNIDEIRKGRHLELAKPYSLENFIEYYIINGKEGFTKKDGLFLIDTLYRDSLHVYFGHINGNLLVNFFKVNQNDLTGINYEEIVGKHIRERFIDEIVPAADKERVERKGWGCTAFSGKQDFSYRYFRNTNEIEITYKWKEVCDFVAKLIDKTYTVRYSLDTKMFSQVNFYNLKEEKKKSKNRTD